MLKEISALILSSGLSERMGKPKALLNWNETTTFIEKIINEFAQFGCGEIICMINKIIEPYINNMKIPDNVKFVINEHPEWSRFYSIKTGVKEVQESEFCYIHNIDNPFINTGLIQKLYNERNKEAWCSPVFNGKGGHPVLLPKFIIEEINSIQDLNAMLNDVLKGHKRIQVEMEDDFVLRNINEPEDYLRYFGKSC